VGQQHHLLICQAGFPFYNFDVGAALPEFHPEFLPSTRGISPGQVVTDLKLKGRGTSATRPKGSAIGFDLRVSPQTLSRSREPLHSNRAGFGRITPSRGHGCPSVFGRFPSRVSSCTKSVQAGLISLQILSSSRPAYLHLWRGSTRSERSQVVGFFLTFGIPPDDTPSVERVSNARPGASHRSTLAEAFDPGCLYNCRVAHGNS
jgi:hypothetical protein